MTSFEQPDAAEPPHDSPEAKKSPDELIREDTDAYLLRQIEDVVREGRVTPDITFQDFVASRRAYQDAIRQKKYFDSLDITTSRGDRWNLMSPFLFFRWEEMNNAQLESLAEKLNNAEFIFLFKKRGGEAESIADRMQQSPAHEEFKRRMMEIKGES